VYCNKVYVYDEHLIAVRIFWAFTTSLNWQRDFLFRGFGLHGRSLPTFRPWKLLFYCCVNFLRYYWGVYYCPVALMAKYQTQQKMGRKMKRRDANGNQSPSLSFVIRCFSSLMKPWLWLESLLITIIKRGGDDRPGLALGTIRAWVGCLWDADFASLCLGFTGSKNNNWTPATSLSVLLRASIPYHRL
jgi:hypothetical protein